MARANLETKLSLDDTSFKAGLRGASMASQKFAKDSAMSMAKSVAAFAVGSLAVSALTRKFSELSEEFDRVGKLATRFDMPVETVQKFALAANLSGTSIERMNAALTKATVAGVEAQKGIKTYSDAFADLNIDVGKFNAMSPDEKIRTLGEAFNQAEDEAVAFTAAYRILGKAGADLVPMLRDVAGAMDQAGEARFLSEEQVRRVEEMNDRMTVLSTTLKTDLMESFLALEPVITRFVGLMGETSKVVGSHFGDTARVNDATTGSYIQPGSPSEAKALKERLHNLQEAGKTSLNDRDDIPVSAKAVVGLVDWQGTLLGLGSTKPEVEKNRLKEIEAVKSRIAALPERDRFMADTEINLDMLQRKGTSQEGIDRYLQMRSSKLENGVNRPASVRQSAARAESAVNDVVSSALSTGTGPGWTPMTFGPVGAVGNPLNAEALDGMSSFEDLTGGEGGGRMAKMYAAAAAAMVDPIWKSKGKSTRGRAMLGGGLDGIAAEGSSFGTVGFGGLKASMKAEANQRIGDPRRLGGDKETEDKMLDADGKQIELLTEQNRLLEQNLTVK